MGVEVFGVLSELLEVYMQLSCHTAEAALHHVTSTEKAIETLTERCSYQGTKKLRERRRIMWAYIDGGGGRLEEVHAQFK